MRKFYAEVKKLDNNEVKIIGHRTRGANPVYYSDNPIIIYKDHISWIIETLKAKSEPDYHKEWFEDIEDHKDYSLSIKTTINRGGSSHLDIIPMWNPDRDDSRVLHIPYFDYADLMKSLEPFITLLEDFLKN